MNRRDFISKISILPFLSMISFPVDILYRSTDDNGRKWYYVDTNSKVYLIKNCRYQLFADQLILLEKGQYKFKDGDSITYDYGIVGKITTCYSKILDGNNNGIS